MQKYFPLPPLALMRTLFRLKSIFQLVLVNFYIVGLPDTAIKESSKRILTALKNSGFRFPAKKITVNLAPADLKKEGTFFDLPIAIGILAAADNIQLILNLYKKPHFWVNFHLMAAFAL